MAVQCSSATGGLWGAAVPNHPVHGPFIHRLHLVPTDCVWEKSKLSGAPPRTHILHKVPHQGLSAWPPCSAGNELGPASGSQHHAMALRAAVSLPVAAAGPGASSWCCSLWVESRIKPQWDKRRFITAFLLCSGGKSKDEISEATDNNDSLMTKF